MKHKLKIAIYSGAVPSTTFIERLIEGLAEKGVKIYLFGIQRKKIVARNNVYLITYSNKLGKLFLLLKYSLLLSLFKLSEKKKLDRIIFKKKKNRWLLKIKYYPVLFHKPTIFHLQWAKSVGDWMWLQEFGIKLVVSLRGTHITISPIGNEHWVNIYNQCFPKIDGFHAVSESMISKAKQFGANPSKISVVRSGLDLSSLHFQNKTIQGTTLNILSVGRSHWVKGYTYALNSAKLLKAMQIDFHYTIVGAGNNEELLYQRSQLDLEKEVIFTKNLEFKDVLELMQLSDVLLLPSVEEGIANVVLEAMALGTLVVSTDCGGMNEVIQDTKNGFLIPIRDASAMANALKKALELTLENYCEISKEGRKTIEYQHSQEKMLTEMQDLYETVLNTNL